VARDSSGNFVAGTITAALSGNATTATTASGMAATGLTGTLQAGQFPALTGDGTTTAGSLAFTLATVGSSGTSTKVTYNAKGLVTSGTTLGLGDLPAGVLTNNYAGPVNLGTNNLVTVSNLTANGSVITFPRLPSTSAVGMVGVTAAGILVSNAIPSGGGGGTSTFQLGGGLYYASDIGTGDTYSPAFSSGSNPNFSLGGSADPVAMACTITNCNLIFVNSSGGALSTGVCIFTLFTNGVASPLTFTATTDGTTKLFTSNTGVTVASGTSCEVQMDMTTDPGVAYLSWAFQVVH
jgi:hypothetical protein